VNTLRYQLASNVTDDTGLMENYDFTMSWVPTPPNSLSPDTDDAGPTIFSAR
jgi:uncharacterized protein (TIGR03435 family)